LPDSQDVVARLHASGQPRGFGVTGLAEGVAVTVLITSTEVALGVE
jgi:multisubunit Na+/H+ antiporter MnhG subunit